MRYILEAFFVAMTISLFFILPALSYADWNGHDGHSHDGRGGHGHDGGHGHSYVGVNFSLWPDNYYYGTPYYPYWDDVLVSLPVTVIEPPTVIVNQAVPVSMVSTVVGTTNDLPDSFTINIPNNKGGYTAVTLKKSGNGYIGPQGEFYPEFPKVSQLEVMYGK